MRELADVAAKVPDGEMAKAVPCARSPLVDENDRAALITALGKLVDPLPRAAAFCLLGNAADAMVEYQQAARAGDSWSALQAYYLLAKSGDLGAAGRILDETHLSERDLLAFFNSVARLDLMLDLLPLARKAVASDPANPAGWKAWLEVGARYTRLQDWPKGLEVYRQAMRAQDSLGVQVGRSSFAVNTGRFYQANLDPRQPETALSFYDQALVWDEFLSLSDKVYAHMYRGEVYRGLRPQYTSAQALAEFQRVLEIDPQNYGARLSIASVYLYDLKDPARAEIYIRQAMALLPENPYAYLSLGDLYRQQGDLARAAAAYQQALLRQPGWQAAEDRLAAVQAEMVKPSP